MTTTVRLVLEHPVKLSPRRFSGVERLGEASTFEIDLSGPKDAPVMPSAVLRKPCLLAFEGDAGGRAVAGLVTKFVVMATDHQAEHRYRLTLRSRFALLELRRPSRNFQDLSIPDIVEKVVKAGGYEKVKKHLSGTYAKRRYVVQYQETDAAFVRRLCEDAGLYFRFEPTDEGEAFVLEDASHDGPAPYPDGLTVVSRSAASETFPMAIDPQRVRVRRPGKVTLRDYDPDHPRVELEGKAQGGIEHEHDIEVYETPGGFTTPGAGTARAKLRLEALRAEASQLAFSTNALALAPGDVVTLAPSPEFHGMVHAAGELAAVAVTTRWAAEGDVGGAEVQAIPRDIPYRLPRITPRPRIAGVQSAWVTGQSGHEIHPDALGRIHLRFHWDSRGKADHESSLPVRVAQPHSPGSMILPRVGWEVFVTFEDGDPDRPFVLGRSYNQKAPPPLSLPANKTVSSIATDSSPGKGARTVIQMNDAAGKEHLLINAPFAKNKKVTGKHTKQTLKNENHQVGANLLAKIGAGEDVSVHLAYMGSYGSRSLNVAAAQYQNAGGNFVTHVSGSEKVAVGAAVLEQVGNPVKGAANLLFAQITSRIGARGTAGAIVAAGLGVGRAVGEGYLAGGAKGAEKAAVGAALGIGASFIPGGEAILASVTGSSKPMPWDHGRPPAGADAAGGGGAGAAGGDAGPAGPGPGHRATLVSSSYSEIVGGSYTVLTPGSISWVTLGASTIFVNGSHTTTTKKAGIKAGGGMVESLGTLTIDSKAVVARKVLGLFRSTVDGALNVSAGGEYRIASKSSLTIKVDGNLQIGGSTVTFKCGGSVISTSSSGVKIKAGSIKITGSSKQSGSLTHK